MISKGHSTMSIAQQCKALSINRSTFYYKPKGESEFNLKLMREMDEHYLEYPFKGAKRMHAWLTKDKGYQVSKNRVERLYYKVMGLQAIMPGVHTSKRCKSHAVYPYLLRNLNIEKPNEVWATDITYIPMKKGSMYLTAIIDLYSRYVVGWSLSNSMDANWCQQTLEQAIESHGKPKSINTDQGSQYTSDVFSSYVIQKQIKLSMDGKGRATDNAFIERLWRSVKYEKVYINPPNDGVDLYGLLAEYFHFYNQNRRHQSIQYQRPIDLYQIIS